MARTRKSASGSSGAVVDIAEQGFSEYFTAELASSPKRYGVVLR